MLKCQECPDGYECGSHAHVPIASPMMTRPDWLGGRTYADYIGMFTTRAKPEEKKVKIEKVVDHPRCPKGLEGSGWDKAMRAIYAATQRPHDDDFISVYADREVFRYIYDLIKVEDKKCCHCGREQERACG